jgi:AraC-like DNA-binding protein
LATIITGFVEGLLQAGTALGLSRTELLGTAGIDEAALLDRDARLPLSAQVAVGRAIIQARPGVNLSLLMLRRMQPGAFGALGYALANSSGLGMALSTFIRYQRHLSDAFRWRQPDGVTLLIDADPEIAELGHPIETAVGLWVALGRRLAQTAWVPRSVHFRHAALGDPAEHAAFFGVAPVFEAGENRLVFDEATLELPVRTADSALYPPMVRLLEAQAPDPVEDGVVARLRHELRRRLPQGDADKPAVARALSMSTRSLTRRLHEAGTRYHAVLEETRRAAALELLSGPGLAVYEVAFLLGYSEPSTFHRAFRRWTGHTPDTWRRVHGGASGGTLPPA